MPRFQGSLPSLTGSRRWAADNRPEFIGAAGQAITNAIQSHYAEKDARAGEGAG
jgi:hypothetical protein